MKVGPRCAALRRAAALGVWIGTCTAGLASALAAEPAGASRVPTPQVERAAKGTQCVADPAFMRRNHMDLLKHQRTETVHLGVRDARASLKGCVECHASAQTGSVAQARTDFCVSCHSYAAVKVDCFECHASKPQATAFHPLRDVHASATTARLLAQWRQISATGARTP